MRPRIELIVDTLVLEGWRVGPGDADRVRAALEEQLATQLADARVVPEIAARGHLAELTALSAPLAPDARPAAIGAHAARALGRCLTESATRTEPGKGGEVE